MEAFELVLLLILAVLLSAILDQALPRISSPLIQIALGIVIAFLAISPIEVSVDPELFLVLFIAPLLFNDALESDKKNLWDNKATFLSYAVGLVIAITLCVGFALHWLIPSIPLAAAFALGAALGPTDAVAVQALKKEVHLGKREGGILQGEALINDASGVVSFQFAISAAVTGAFSVLDATEAFFISFVGGIILGVVLALVFLLINGKVRELGLDNVTFHVLFEVSMPFVVYLLSEVVGVSGILGVVACAIMWAIFRDRKVSPYQSRLNIALTSVWKVFSFTLNGIVFVLLGIQLPNAMQSTWDNLYINNFEVIGYVLLLTLLVVGLRFIWALAMARLFKNPDTQKRDHFSKHMIKHALITTIGGPKGAVTLSIAFTIPYFLADGSAFPQRSLIIFLASGVILCTLLLANFLLPVLAPKGEGEMDAEEFEEVNRTKIEIMRTVIERLLIDATPETDAQTKVVVNSYNTRIKTMRNEIDAEEPSMQKLRVEIIDYEAKRLIEAVDNHEINEAPAFEYMSTLNQRRRVITHSKRVPFTNRFPVARFRSMVTILWRKMLANVSSKYAQDKKAVAEVHRMAEEYAIEYLEGLIDNPEYPSEVIARLHNAHQRTLDMLNTSDETSVTYEVVQETMISVDDIQREALQIELEVIQDYYSEGRLSRAQAKDMRDNVSLMLLDVDEHI